MGLPRVTLCAIRRLRWGLLPSVTGGTLVAAAALGMVAGPIGTASPFGPDNPSLAAAESVASSFVVGFESYGASGPQSASVAGLATGPLATLLSSSAASGSADALAQEQYRVTATVQGFEVAGQSPTVMHLLADTELIVSTSSGSTQTTRQVTLTMTHISTGWRVSEAAGIDGTSAAPAGSSSGQSPSAGPGPSSGTSAPPSSSTPSRPIAPSPPAAVGDIPAGYVALFEAASTAQCPGLSWTVLAGIGKVESDFGRSTLPGVSSGANYAGAEGPMQFETATFARYAVVAPGGASPPSPYDAPDAVYSAAHLLCANGAGNPATLFNAIFDYNHSDAYVQLVLAYAGQYATDAANGSVSSSSGPGAKSPSPADSALASVIIAYAKGYIGTPYVWGGENPKIGFDCSGLVQWVFAEAGVRLPRVAQSQYNFGPVLSKGITLDPGDLVFFGSGPKGVEHVGIYVGNGEMIDAPHTGADVRYDSINLFDPARVGATRPEIPNVTSVAGVPVVADPGPSSPPGTLTDSSAGHPPRQVYRAPTYTGPTDTAVWQGWNASHRPPLGSTVSSTTSTTTSSTTSTTSSTPTNHYPSSSTVGLSEPTRPGRYGSHFGTTSTTSPPPPTTRPPTTVTTVNVPPGTARPPTSGWQRPSGTSSTTTTTTATITTTPAHTSTVGTSTTGTRHTPPNPQHLSGSVGGSTAAGANSWNSRTSQHSRPAFGR